MHRMLTLSVRTLSKAWMMRVECHHSGGFTMSATAVDAAPLFAWILQTGRNRPAGKASLNSLYGTYQHCHEPIHMSK